MLNEHLDVNRQVHHLRTITCWTAACTIVLALLLSLGILTSCGSPIPTPPSLLTVSPTHIEIASSSCSSNNVICRSTSVVLLHNTGQRALHWSAAAQSGPDWSIVFTPAQGTLGAGQTISVQIAFNGGACPAFATLTFTGLANTVAVHWDCAETNQP